MNREVVDPQSKEPAVCATCRGQGAIIQVRWARARCRGRGRCGGWCGGSLYICGAVVDLYVVPSLPLFCDWHLAACGAKSAIACRVPCSTWLHNNKAYQVTFGLWAPVPVLLRPPASRFPLATLRHSSPGPAAGARLRAAGAGGLPRLSRRRQQGQAREGPQGACMLAFLYTYIARVAREGPQGTAVPLYTF